MMVTQSDIAMYPEKYLLNMIALFKYDAPVLGICFGCQLVYHALGGRLRKLETKLNREMRVTMAKEHTMIHNARFNCNYIMEKPCPKNMDVLASFTLQGCKHPCFVKHRERPIYGILFHPESGKTTRHMISAFNEICKRGE